MSSLLSSRLKQCLEHKPHNTSGVQRCSVKVRGSGLGGLRVPDFKLQPEYKEKIARHYDKASQRYDEGEWHPRIAKNLVDGCAMKKGDRVLDLCAGTGISTLLAAEAVGPHGRVVGVDISKQMLSKLRDKIESLGLKGIEVIEGDAETIQFPPESFDWILCSSAFIWMSDLAGALARWKKFLVRGGGIAFHAFPEEAFVTGVVMINAASKHGVELTMGQPTGNETLVQELLQIAEYSSIHIDRQTDGCYLPLEKAQAAFDGMVDPSCAMTAPIIGIPSDVLENIRKDYLTEMKERASSSGVWNDMSILYTYAYK